MLIDSVVIIVTPACHLGINGCLTNDDPANLLAAIWIRITAEPVRINQYMIDGGRSSSHIGRG